MANLFRCGGGDKPKIIEYTGNGTSNRTVLVDGATFLSDESANYCMIQCFLNEQLTSYANTTYTFDGVSARKNGVGNTDVTSYRKNGIVVSGNANATGAYYRAILM